MKFLIFALISVMISQAYSAVSFGSCATDPIIADFDASKYVGKWYEVERVDYIFEANLQCVTAEYGGINATFVSVKNGGLNINTQQFDYINGYAYVPNVAEPSKLKVVLPIIVANTTLFENTGNYNVWQTDYTQYSVVYSCKQVIPKVLKYEIVWLLSRTKTLDQQLVQNLKQILKDKGVDTSKFLKVDQSCAN